MKNVIFIVGVGRSGTSLLQSFLNAHPDIAFTPETQFVRKYLAKAGLKAKIEVNPKSFFIDLLNQDKEFARASTSPETIVADGKVSVVDTYQTFLDTYTSVKNKNIAGDKDPRNLDLIKTLYQYFPQGKVIHIIRDPRDVVASRMKADWSSKTPFLLHPMMYNAQFHRGRRIGKQYYGDNYFEIKYETLISDPESPLKAICAFLGVNFEPGMLNFAESSKELVSESEMQWKKETLGPLLSKNSGKWRKTLTPNQIYYVQTLCSEVLQEFGYEKDKVSPSIITRISASCMRIVSAIFSVLYPLRIKYLL